MKLQEVLISILPLPSLLFCLPSAVSPAGPTLQEISLHIQDSPGEDGLLHLVGWPGQGEHLPVDVHRRQVADPHLASSMLKGPDNIPTKLATKEL